MNTLKDLEKAVITEVAADIGKQTLEPDEDLLEQGIIDSLGLMKLIEYIEKAYSIKVNDEEIVPENFQNLNVMTRFVQEKMQK